MPDCWPLPRPSWLRAWHRVHTTGHNRQLETAALQQRLQHVFPDSLRQRLRELTRKSEEEALTPDERAEYIALAEQREAADAERLQVVLRLAQLRGVPPAQLLEELGIGATGHG